jgi:hypothetical protein
MALIGTRAHAQEILQARDSDGFRSIGSGGSRSAYLHEATGVVYKITSDWWREYGANGTSGYSDQNEVRQAQKLYKLNHTFKWVRIPATSMFRFADNWNVVAMEYVQKSGKQQLPQVAYLELFMLGIRGYAPLQLYPFGQQVGAY